MDNMMFIAVWNILQDEFQYKSGDDILYDDIEHACDIIGADFDSILLNCDLFEDLTNCRIVIYL